MAKEVDHLLWQLQQQTERGGSYGAVRPHVVATRRPESRASQQPLPPARTRAGPTPLGAWVRSLVGVILVVGIGQWPYPQSCGFPLFAYLGAVAMLLVCGAWAAHAAWQTRNGAAHIVALAVFTAGIILANAQVFPRIGGPDAVAAWFCSR
ncbi:MAG TPA: hypothetical protein VK939_02865 [Longimicrobiales bacterium]|nr:hypothetical protein [Longimicrobiales bacterium]